MLNLGTVTTIEQSMHDYFNDYPCEWSKNNEGLWDWSLHYKTGSLMGWIEAPESDSSEQVFIATFSPTGWESIRSDNARQEALTLEDAKSWLQTRVLNFLYPEGWQFSGTS